MWLLVLITILNAALKQEEVQNTYRISLGVIQIGIFDVLLIGGFLYAMGFGGGIRARFPAVKTHPILLWILTLIFLGTGFGLLGGLLQGNFPKWILSGMREYLSQGLCVLIGYRLIGSPKDLRTISIATLIAGLITASVLLYDFMGTTEKASLTGSLNPVRSIIGRQYSEYAPIAALVLVFVILTRYPLWRTWTCVGVGLYCFIGYAATLSRVGFLILLFGTASSYMLLVRGERLRHFFRSLMFIPVLAIACWGSLSVADQIVGRNFAGKVLNHMASLLPGEQEGVRSKAWDSRIGGISAELAIWARNPLMGQGFGVGDTTLLSGKGAASFVSFRHNGWTSTLAETGFIGFLGLFLMHIGMMVMSYRMVHRRTDWNYVLIGAVAFFTGVVSFMRVSCTLAISTRSAMSVALICGVLIRAREMEIAQQAMEFDAEYEPYRDETGLLVPDYRGGAYVGLD